MVWVTFTDDYNWRATNRSFVQYRKGERKNVTRRCAADAIAAGKAEPDGAKASAPEADDPGTVEPGDEVIVEAEPDAGA